MPRKLHRTSIPPIQRIDIHPGRNSCLLEVQSRIAVSFTLSNMVAEWGVRIRIIHSPNQFEGIDGRMSLKLNENTMRADICPRAKQPLLKRVSRLNHEVAEACSFSIPLQILFRPVKSNPRIVPVCAERSDVARCRRPRTRREIRRVSRPSAITELD